MLLGSKQAVGILRVTTVEGVLDGCIFAREKWRGEYGAWSLRSTASSICQCANERTVSIRMK